MSMNFEIVYCVYSKLHAVFFWFYQEHMRRSQGYLIYSRGVGGYILVVAGAHEEMERFTVHSIVDSLSSNQFPCL